MTIQINMPSTKKCPRFRILPWQRRQPLLQGKRCLQVVNGVERAISDVNQTQRSARHV